MEEERERMEMVVVFHQERGGEEGIERRERKRKE